MPATMPFSTRASSALGGANGIRNPSSRNMTRPPRPFAATADQVSLRTVLRHSSTAPGIEPIVPRGGDLWNCEMRHTAARRLGGVAQALRLGQRRELPQRGVLDLARALAREPEQLRHLVERLGLLAADAVAQLHDPAIAVRERREPRGQPFPYARRPGARPA